MLVHRKNREIDHQKWDKLVRESPEGIVYALSWYLNIVSPNWEALIWELEGKYLAGVPLPTKKQLIFIKTVMQPDFCQQLGLFSIPEPQKKELIEYSAKWIQKGFVKLHYQFNWKNSAFLKETVVHQHLKERLTHHLNLSASYPDIFKAYSDNQKRNIKKAKKLGLIVKEGLDIEIAITLFKEGKGIELTEVNERHYTLLTDIYSKASERKLTELLYVYDQENNIIASALFILFGSKIIYLFGAASNVGKEKGAMALVFDFVIQKHSETEMILDFEGSNIPSLARFYKGFGAEEVHYFALSYNKLKPF